MIDACDIEDTVAEAKCCAVNLAGKYVEALNYGEQTEAKCLTLSLMLNSIDVLERQIPCDEQCVNDDELISSEDFLLTSDNKLISLGCSGKDVCETDCLSDKEIFALIENINLLCNQCKC